MNRFKILATTASCALFLALIVMMVRAQDAVPTDTDAPMDPSAVEALAGPGFRYQGKLDSSGSPVTSLCDFQFSLWTIATGGSQIGGTETLGNIAVDQGVFSTIINRNSDFGYNPFTGDRRYLQIAVRCPAGSGAYSTLTPRQSILPVPYALSLPGVYTNSGGKVGIGTTNPIAPLHIKEDSNDGTTLVIDGVSSVNPDISFRLNGSFAGRIRLERNREEMDFTVANNSGTETWAMSLAPDHVRLRVLRIVGGSDLSEQFDVSESKIGLEPVPGSVVCIDAINPGKLIVCNQAYDTTVAGIISGAGGVETGMLMSHDGTIADGEYPVALTGRVYVYADASNGSIQPGDLLTTAATPGHAMKVSNHTQSQGAILGKAMTTLNSGQGLVLVLVSLQ